MQVEYERCCGIDVHKETVVACVIAPGAEGKPSKAIRTFRTLTGELKALAQWLTEHGVTHVAMESTGAYWKPVYNVLEGQFELVGGQRRAPQKTLRTEDRCGRCRMDCRPVAPRFVEGEFHSLDATTGLA